MTKKQKLQFLSQIFSDFVFSLEQTHVKYLTKKPNGTFVNILNENLFYFDIELGI